MRPYTMWGYAMNLIAFFEKNQIKNTAANSLPIERTQFELPVQSFSDILSQNIRSSKESEAPQNNIKSADQKPAEQASSNEDTTGKDQTAIHEQSGHTFEIIKEMFLAHAKPAELSDKQTVKKADHELLNTRAKTENTHIEKETGKKNSVDQTSDILLSLMHAAQQIKNLPAAGNNATPMQIRDLLARAQKNIHRELDANLSNKQTDTQQIESLKRNQLFARELTALMNRKDKSAPERIKGIDDITNAIMNEMKKAGKGNDRTIKNTVLPQSSPFTPEAHNDANKETPKATLSQQIGSASNTKFSHTEGESQNSSFMKQFGSSREVSMSRTPGVNSGSSLPFSTHLDELIEKANITIRDGKNSQLSMRMNPESLGRVNVQLGMENGVLNAKFLVESEDARQTLNDSLHHLKNALENDGITLGSFQVDVRDEGKFDRSQVSDAVDAIIIPHKAIEEATIEYGTRQVAVHDGRIDLVI
jgi:flagellar hook-length control protein FliK